MLFNSISFAIFFPLVFVIYWSNVGNRFFQNLVLIAASYIFYGWWDPRFLVLIAISTTTDYWCGIGASGETFTPADHRKPVGFLALLLLILALLGVSDLEWIALLVGVYSAAMLGGIRLLARLPQARRKNAYLYISVIINLGILGFFKYFNFFADSLQTLAEGVGWSPGFVTLHIILPVGISFYTFQTMSYTLDIYRGKLKPTRRFTDIVAYVSFFPQLVAGPIERARHLLPQFEQSRSLTYERITGGLGLFVWGLYKKIVIADNVAPIADRVFQNPDAITQGEILVGVLAFAFQIYCDFSGYSDMARGSARLLGFDLMVNFRVPYISRTPSEFWQRWHISLSTWLRDYLYIPLGGNKKGLANTYRNLMLTMGLGGLWHGASWTFVAWGLFHGIILVVYRILRIDAHLAAMPVRRLNGLVTHGFAMIVMFTLVCIGWVFFRAQTFPDAYLILSRTLEPVAWTPALSTLIKFVLPLAVMEALYAAPHKDGWWHHKVRSFASFNFYLFAACSLAFLAASGGQEFIYFDF